MGEQLYFDNYMPVGDIIVLSVSLVMMILLATSHVTRTRNFLIFLNMLFYLMMAGLVNLLMHVRFTRITDGNYTSIYVMGILYHAFLFSLFLLYIVYLVVIFRLDGRIKTFCMRISVAMYVLFLATDIFTTAIGVGFHINKNGTASTGLAIFMIGYLAFVLLIAALLIQCRKRIYRKAILGIYGIMAISYAVLYMQSKHDQTSFTVATFLLPVLGIMYLFHSNPYNIELGSVSATAFTDTIDYLFRRKRSFGYISLYLPGYEFGDKKLPEKLQESIRKFSSEFFKRSILFRISSGQMLLIAEHRGNPDFEQKMQVIKDAFRKEYEVYGLDFRLLIGESVDEISENNEYLALIQHIHNNTELNNIHIITKEDVESFHRTMYILRELEDIYKKQDLEDPRVLAYCQPIWNITDGKYDTAETLMRLQLDKIGMVFPDEFIPLAEKNGYIHVLTKIILYKTCMAVKSLVGDGYYVRRISVNVSVLELHDDNFTADIEQIIRQSEIPEGKIAIEITESQSDRDFLAIKSMIDELKDCGIKFYLDDFGTGYSNMERIMKLPFDIIKFDRSLVLASQSDERSEEIVGRLAGMFADLDYSVLYEGVEDETDEQRCIRMSANFLQGYKYSKPIPVDRLEDFFSKAE